MPIRFPTAMAHPSPSTAKLTHQYTPTELISIGSVCGAKLPPSSSVQAMFLYELQRAAEDESLFRGTLFRLTRADSASEDHATRLTRIEEALAAMERAMTVSDVQQRLAGYKIRLDAQGVAISEYKAKSDAQGAEIERMKAEVARLKETIAAGAVEEAAKSCPVLKAEVETLQLEVGYLFEDRDALLENQRDQMLRISRLEDLVRSLTAQQTSASAATSGNVSPLVQTLAVRAPNGQAVALTVPKGNGIALTKENRAPVRTFTPGKPWGS